MTIIEYQKAYEEIITLQKEYLKTNKNTLQQTHYKQLGSTFLTSKQLKTIRDKHTATLSSKALAQVDIQKSAYLKHGKIPEYILFTRQSLEQSTQWTVAQIHGHRYKKIKSGKIADLGCGVGIDSWAIAQNITHETKLTAYELQAEEATLATHNLKKFSNVTVKNQNIFDINFKQAEFEAIYVDPARRKNNKRILDPKQWTPPLDTVYEWLNYCPNIGIKIAPGTQYSHLHPDSETNWLSINGQLVEASMWFGKLKNHTGKTATVINTKQEKQPLILKYTFDNNATNCQTQIDVTKIPLQKNLYITQIDPAILRANGLSYIAKEINGKLISENISYLISNQENQNTKIQNIIKQLKIIDYCQLKPKKIDQMLQTHDIGTIEIKKKGTDIIPDSFRKKIKLKGKNKATLILTRYQSKHIALLAQNL